VDSPTDGIRADIIALKRELADLLDKRDSGAQLLRVLTLNVPPADVATSEGDRVWELCGIYLFNKGRVHEALVFFLELYNLKVAAQASEGRVHKGSPLIWIISYCFSSLGFPAHAKRYAMLAMCEDAIEGKGAVSLDGGAYFQLAWIRGMREADLNAYARRVFQIAQQAPQLAQYPEALLQQLDDSWMTEVPSTAELFHYVLSRHYVNFLLGQVDATNAAALEDLAEYLISCIAGCRCGKRKQSASTEYDLVCSIEGPPIDFRAEWGRYFVCEQELKAQS
jgi:hypothetical protein